MLFFPFPFITSVKMEAQLATCRCYNFPKLTVNLTHKEPIIYVLDIFCFYMKNIADHSSVTPAVSDLEDEVYFCFDSVYCLEPNHPKAFFVRFNTSFSDVYSACFGNQNQVSVVINI